MSELSFNPVDISVVLIILFSALLAFWRGFLREIFAIAAWVGAVILTLQLLPVVRPLAREQISLKILADSVAAGAIFVISLVVLSVISSMVAGRVRTSGLNVLDRSIGALFGLLRGAALVSLAYLAIFLLYRDGNLPNAIAAARVTPAVHVGAKLLLYLAPEELTAGSRRILDQFDALGVDRLTLPGAKSGADSDSETGYKTNTRKDLDRLIRRTQNE